MEKLDSQRLGRELEALEALHLRRQRRLVEALTDPTDSTRVRVDGVTLHNFCSNDYLGLSTHPKLIEAATAAMQRFGLGAGAAHLVTGHSAEHHALEEELAAFTGRERALLFSTGYMANLGTISALAEHRDRIVEDKWNHASLLDGARLAQAQLRRYAHADVEAAERLLAGPDEAHEKSVALLVTDGVFSMDGDLAPLPGLAAAARRHDATLIVDDAHGLGVLGATGRGTLEALQMPVGSVPVLIGTLGKAFGTFGAFVAGDATLIDYLIQQARTYIYTTALPPSIAAATRASLKLVIDEGERRERLRAHIARFREAAAAYALPLMPSTTPIQPLIVAESALAMDLSAALRSKGFWVAAIRPPTVPKGAARLRITLSAAHREADIDALVESLGTLWRARRTS